MGEGLNKVIVLANPAEWCYYSWKGVLADKKILFFKDGIPLNSEGLLKMLWKKHFSLNKSHSLRFPLRFVWYKRMCKDMGLNNVDNIVLITYDWNTLALDHLFYSYIRKNYSNVKLVYLFSNIVKITGANYYGYLNNLKLYYDQIYAFDKCDAQKYGFRYFPLIYVKNEDAPKSTSEVDLFYIGQAKDENRLNILLEIFEKAQDEGLVCEFHIVGVEEAKQKYKDKIVYNKPIGYLEALEGIMKAKCLVDVIQKESTGLTIKTCESVIYDKKLITSNVNVASEPFYSENRILVYEKNINLKLKKFIDIPFSSYSKDEKDKFSPYVLFNEIEK